MILSFWRDQESIVNVERIVRNWKLIRGDLAAICSRRGISLNTVNRIGIGHKKHGSTRNQPNHADAAVYSRTVLPGERSITLVYTLLHGGVIAGAVYETWFIFTASILFTRSASANNHAPLPPPSPDRPSKRPRNTRGFMSEHVALPVLLLFAGQVLGSGYLYPPLVLILFRSCKISIFFFYFLLNL